MYPAPLQGAAWEPHRQQRSTTEQASAAKVAAQQPAAKAPAAEGAVAVADSTGVGAAAVDGRQQKPEQQQREQQAQQQEARDQPKPQGQQGAEAGGGAGVDATVAVEVLKDDSSAMIDPAATDPQVCRRSDCPAKVCQKCLKFEMRRWRC